MARVSTNVISIINSGANVVVDGSKYNSISLTSMARAAATKGVMLTIKNASRFTTISLVSIGNAGKKSVTIEV